MAIESPQNQSMVPSGTPTLSSYHYCVHMIPRTTYDPRHPSHRCPKQHISAPVRKVQMRGCDDNVNDVHRSSMQHDFPETRSELPYRFSDKTIKQRQCLEDGAMEECPGYQLWTGTCTLRYSPTCSSFGYEV